MCHCQVILPSSLSPLPSLLFSFPYSISYAFCLFPTSLFSSLLAFLFSVFCFPIFSLLSSVSFSLSLCLFPLLSLLFSYSAFLSPPSILLPFLLFFAIFSFLCFVLSSHFPLFCFLPLFVCMLYLSIHLFFYLFFINLFCSFSLGLFSALLSVPFYSSPFSFLLSLFSPILPSLRSLPITSFSRLFHLPLFTSNPFFPLHNTPLTSTLHSPSLSILPSSLSIFSPFHFFSPLSFSPPSTLASRFH